MHKVQYRNMETRIKNVWNAGDAILSQILGQGELVKIMQLSALCKRCNRPSLCREHNV